MANSSSIKKRISKTINDIIGPITQINQEVFDNPETCFNEKFATRLMVNCLADAGFKTETPYAGLKTAFKASRSNGKPGPTIALIAEYDALPGIGHACGHNMIAASAYGAAVAISKAAPDFPGKLLVIGTPAEEGGGGKVKMINKRAFDGVDAAIMTHPSNKTRVICRMYAIAELEFTFLGKAAHAAAFPDRGVNALDAGVLFYNAVSTLRQQMRDEARVHGIFTHGGDAPNIIPERIVMDFFIRSLDRKYFRELVKKIIATARASAKSAGCTVKIKRKGHEYEPFYPSRPMGEAFRRNMKTIGVKEDGFNETDEIGSSDIGNLSLVAPTLHPEYAVGAKSATNHSREFLTAVTSKQGISAMLDMTRAMAMTVYDLLTDKKLMAQVKAEFAKQ